MFVERYVKSCLGILMIADIWFHVSKSGLTHRINFALLSTAHEKNNNNISEDTIILYIFTFARGAYITIF